MTVFEMEELRLKDEELFRPTSKITIVDTADEEQVKEVLSNITINKINGYYYPTYNNGMVFFKTGDDIETFERFTDRYYER